jgi:hypothetical protein
MKKGLFLFIFTLQILVVFAQKTERKGEFYFSWGYNKDYYTNTNIFVNQPSLGNNFNFKNTILVDHPGWDEGLFNTALSIPQYNYRFGYFFDKNKDWAFEINFDHTKALIKDNHSIHLVGIYHGASIDSTFNFSKTGDGTSRNYYYLNNGANFLLFNIVKRNRFKSLSSKNIAIDGLGKFGIGPLIPHVQNSLFGKENDSKFQFGGWNTGTEYALRSTFYKKLYLEFSGKLDYAMYYNLNVFEGNARQNFGTLEFILSFGYNIPMGPKLTAAAH